MYYCARGAYGSGHIYRVQYTRVASNLLKSRERIADKVKKIVGAFQSFHCFSCFLLPSSVAAVVAASSFANYMILQS